MQRIAAPVVSEEREAAPTSDQQPPRGARARRPAQTVSAARPQAGGEASEGRPEAALSRSGGRPWGGYTLGSGMGGGFMLGSGN